jgi:hypothetical protein
VNGLQQVAEELWILETPLRFLGMPIGRRMAVARLAGGELFVHSPAELTDVVRGALDDLGLVRFVVPASSLHGHLFMDQYHAAYPEALLFAAPRLEQRRQDLRFDGELEDQPDPRWAQDVDQLLFRGPSLGAEVLFLHRASRSLLVGDVVWNVTPTMGWAPRVWAGWRPGVRPTPLFRLGLRDRQGAREAVRRVLEWDFDRIVIGHGEMVHSGGREAFRQAYRALAS